MVLLGERPVALPVDECENASPCGFQLLDWGLAVAVKKIDCKNAEEAFEALYALAKDDHRDMYFRGLSKEGYDLGTTYSRHTITHHKAGQDLEEMVDHFINSLISTGKQ
jgi:hypothetical protein